jgi:6-phosphogluconolactonase (cycloisomerase 2 family)
MRAPQQRFLTARFCLVVIALSVCFLAACAGAGRSANTLSGTSNGTPGPTESGNIGVVSTTPQPRDFVYVTNSNSDTIASFEADSDTGALLPLTGAPFASNFFPRFAFADPAGRFLFVSNTGGRNAPLSASNVRVHAINPDGSLTLVSDACASGCTAFLRGVPAEVVTDPAGKFLFVGNFTQNLVTVFSVGNDGTLTEVAGSPIATGTSDVGNAPIHLAVDGAGRFLFAAVNFNIVVFRIDPGTGALTAVTGSPFSPGLTPFALSVASGSNFLLVTDVNASTVSALPFDPATGALSLQGGGGIALAGISPVDVTATPTGNFVVVANAGTSSVAVFRLDPVTGTLTAAPGSAFLTGGVGATAVSVDPTGRFVFVANGQSNDLSVFTLDPTTGTLTSVGANIAAGQTPSSLVVVRK